MALTKAIRERLPREIRDIIYLHLLDDETITEVHNTALEATIGRIYWLDPQAAWPHFLKRNAIDQDILVEIVQAFCAHNKHFIVHEPNRIWLFLETRYFNTNVTLWNTVFSCLTLEIHAQQYTGLWKVGYFPFSFSAFKDSRLRYAAGFILNIRIREHVDKGYPCAIYRKREISTLFVRTLVAMLGTIRPLSAYFRELGSGRKVDVRLEVKDKHEYSFNIAEEEMGRSEEEWIGLLSAVLIPKS